MNRVALFVVTTGLVWTAAVSAQTQTSVRLISVTPANATPGLTNASLLASGFPAGTIPPADLRARLTPTGGGPAVDLPVTSITTLIGNQRRVIFPVPAALAVATPTAFALTLVGLSPNTPIGSLNPLPFTLLPAASLTSISPAAGRQGQTIPVQIDAQYSNFLAGQTQLSIAGGGVTVSNLTVVNPTRLTANLNLALNAAIGLRGLQITTGGEVINAASAFEVQPSNASISSIAPSQGQQGQTLDVVITGAAVFFQQGVTQAFFGDSVQVNSVTVLSSTQLRANVTVNPIANSGFRSVTVNTSGQIATAANGFQVVPGPAAISSITPNQGQQGQSLQVTVTGSQTHFSNATQVSLGSGVNATISQVISATSVVLNVAVSETAAIGARSLTLTTGGEQVSGAFTVTGGTPQILSLTPSSGQQGQTLAVNITGKFTNFASGANGTNINFGAGITLNSLTVNSPTSLTANVTISPIAAAGGRSVLIVTPSANNETLNAGFSVTGSGASLSSVAPSSGQQGQELQVEINGTNTNFQQGVTTVSFGLNGITVNGVTVQSPTKLLASLTIANNAAAGARTLFVATGGESLTLNGAFTVVVGTPTILSLSPSQGIRGQNVAVTIQGQFTTWDSTTTVQVSGANVAVQNLTVVDADTITATFAIGGTAQLGPRTVSISTGGNQLTTTFTVVNNTQTLISSIIPGSALQGTQALDVTIGGNQTNFAQGQSVVTFAGSGISIVSTTVNSATQLVVRINIADNAAATSRDVTVTTGGEVVTLANGFTVLPQTPQITEVNPSQGQQGQTLNVTLTGRFTRWTQGTLTATFGTGITVNSITAATDTSATANVTIDPITTLGFRNTSVTVTIGGQPEVANLNSGFSVIAGPANISSVTPGSGSQGSTVNGIVIVGSGTHFANGSSTVSFGSGITVLSAVVNSATQITANVQIDPSAATGLRSVSVTTGGEVASRTNAFNVIAATPILLSVTDANAAQGQAKTLTILGQFTKFTEGTATVSLGQGITVGAVTVANDTSLTAQITVSPTAFTGSRSVTVTYGASPVNVVLTNGFSVTAGPASLLSANPASGKQGETLTSVVITGLNTHFETGKTQATFFDSLITIGSLTVNSPTQVTLNNVVISALATTGPRTVRLTTDGETAQSTGLFVVEAATPIISSLSPTSGQQGQTIDVTLNGSFTSFAQGASTVSFGAGITVNTVTVNSPTQLVANITISPIAFTGFRDIGVTTDLGAGLLQNASRVNGFQVTAGTFSLTSVTPTSGGRGTTISVTVIGTNTNFAAGKTTANFGGDITPSAVNVVSPTEATVQIAIGINAALGFRNVTMTTDGQVATRVNGFEVVQGTPTLLPITPTTIRQGETQDILISGQFTTFQQGVSTVTLGAGITINTVTVNSPTSITANISAAVDAVQGNRDLTVTTGAQVVTRAGALTVQAGLPRITQVDPIAGEQGNNYTLIIDGLFTNWDQTTPVVTFSGGGITTGAVQVNGPTRITVPIQIETGASAGARTVTATAGSQVASLANGFTVLPGVPKLTLINPNVGVQGTTSLNVTIRGQFANFTNATTVQFGEGISVGGAAAGAAGPIAQLISANEIRVNIAIAASAPLGSRLVSVTTGANTLTVPAGFNVAVTDTTPPSLLTITPNNGGTNIPLNTAVVLEFNEPINRDTFNSATFQLYEGISNRIIPGTYDVDATGRIATFVPSESLLANRNYTPYHCSTPRIQDQSGNNFQCTSYSFATGLDTSTVGPSFLISNIIPGSTNVGTNSPVRLRFSQSISPTSRPNNIRVLLSGGEVPGTWVFQDSFRIFQFTPAAPFSANTAYTVEFTNGLTNFAGLALTNPGSIGFTTAAAADATSPTVTSLNIVSEQSGVGINATPSAQFSEAIDATRFANLSQVLLYEYNDVNQSRLMPATIELNPARNGFRLVPDSPLRTNTRYFFQVCSYFDVAGIGGSCPSVNFYTGTGSDATPPAVSGTNPPSGATGVGTNVIVSVQMSEPVTQESFDINADAIELRQGATVIAGTRALSTDRRTLTFTPSAALNASTVYTIRVQKLADAAGNVMAVSNTGFTTGAAAITGNFTLTSSVPVNGTQTVPLNQPVVLTFARPINPLTFVRPSAWNARVQSPAGVGQYENIAATVTINGAVVTITPVTGTWSPNSLVQVDLNSNIRDFQNNAYVSGSINFRTVAGAGDTTPPTVTGVTPTDGTTGVGDITPIIISFSEAMLDSSLTTDSIALFAGNERISYSRSNSTDNRMVTLTADLRQNTDYTVVVTPAATDLAGNPLGQELRSTFRTGPSFSTTGPAITNFLPTGSGVQRDARIVLYASRPLNPATVNTDSVVVLQNGVRITGAVQLSGDNRTITFTPTGLFAYSALIQVFYYSTIQDTDGNALQANQFSFNVVPDPVSQNLTLTTWGPVNQGAAEPAPRNFSFWFRFNLPLDPATVNATVVRVTDRFNAQVPVVVTLVGDRNIQVTQVNPATLPFDAVNAGQNYVYWNIAGLKSLSNKTYNGSTFIYYSNNTDSVPPAVRSMAPLPGSTVAGTNADIRIYFNDLINGAAIDPPIVTLNGPGGAIPFTSSLAVVTPSSQSSAYNLYDNGGQRYHVLTVSPTVALPESAVIQFQMDGVRDAAGNVLPLYTQTFTTRSSPEFERPISEATNVFNGQTNVPVNSVFSVLFSEPMDEGSFRRWWYLYDNVGPNPLGQRYLDGTLGFSPDRRFVTFAPARNLTVGRSHQFGLSTFLLDMTGNQFTSGAFNFTSAFTPDTTPPSILHTNPTNGGSNPYTTRIQIRFNEPISPSELSQVRLFRNGNVEVQVNKTMSDANRLLTISGLVPLLPNTPHTVQINGVKDVAGNQMANSQILFNTTGGADIVRPTIISSSPAINSTNVPTNTVFRARFSEAIAPASINYLSNVRLYAYNSVGGGSYFVDAVVELSPDRRELTLTPAAPLAPNTQYYIDVQSNYTDLSGNQGLAGYQGFIFTGSGSDAAPPTVSSINPPAGSTSVPTNAIITVQMSEAIQPATVSNSSIAVTSNSTPVTGLVSIVNSTTLTFTPSAPFVVSANFSVAVTGLRDLAGNQMAAFNSTFSTGAGPVTGGFTILSFTGLGGINLSGAAAVPNNTSITVTFARPINPQTFRLGDTFRVIVQPTGGAAQYDAPMVASVNGAVVTMTLLPGQVFPANASITARPWSSGIADLAGNAVNYAQALFTIANGSDTTAPTVTQVSPANGATGVGRWIDPAITFSESMNRNTLSTNTIALYGPNQQRVSASISSSIDGRIAILAPSALAENTLYTIVVTTAATDVAGNPLAQQFTSTFTTAPSRNLEVTQVSGTIPANASTGWDRTVPITLYFSKALDPASVNANTVRVSQNGDLITGTLQVRDQNRTVVFTPTAPFDYSARIEIFATDSVRDSFGNPINDYNGYFTVQPDPASVTTLTLQAWGPVNQSSTNPAPRNFSLAFRFNKPLNPSTVNTTNIFLRDSFNAGVPVNIELLENNRVVRVTPQNPAALPFNAGVPGQNYVYWTFNNVAAADGSIYNGSTFIYYGAANDTTAPTVTSVSPVQGSTTAGTNSLIRVTFSEPVVPALVSGNTIRVTGPSGYNANPYRIDGSSDNRTFTLYPLTALPASATITVTVTNVGGEAAILDAAGNRVVQSTTTFQTLPGIDTQRPTPTYVSPTPFNVTNVPVNAPVVISFDEPMDPESIRSGMPFYFNGNYQFDYTVTQSADLRTFVLTYNTPLPSNTTIQVFPWLGSPRDLTGNTVASSPNIYFTTSAATDAAPPTVTHTSPAAGFTGVPTNSMVRIRFNEAIQGSPQNLAGVRLLQSGSPVASTVSTDGMTVTITPASLLAINTTYTVEITGVRDWVGNVMAGTVTYAFLTGVSADLTAPSLVAVRPLNGTTNVDRAAPGIEVEFSEPMDVVRMVGVLQLRFTNTSAVVPASISYKAGSNGTIVQITPSALPLDALTAYRVFLTNFALANNLGGFSLSFNSLLQNGHSFTTGN
jgi:hypothetical protein